MRRALLRARSRVSTLADGATRSVAPVGGGAGSVAQGTLPTTVPMAVVRTRQRRSARPAGGGVVGIRMLRI